MKKSVIKRITKCIYRFRYENLKFFVPIFKLYGKNTANFGNIELKVLVRRIRKKKFERKNKWRFWDKRSFFKALIFVKKIHFLPDNAYIYIFTFSIM